MVEGTDTERMQEVVEAALREAFPDVEVVDVELRGGAGATATVYIDRPGGVDLATCEAVARSLDQVRAEYALEVSSPGLDRPLRRHEHFERAVGERVYVKTSPALDGRAVFRGRLERAGGEGIALDLDEGEKVDILYETIAKAHVIFDFNANGGHRE